MRSISLLFTVFLWTASTVNGQVQFSNRNDLLADGNLHSGVPVAIADMNGDGLDDLVCLDEGSYVYIQYQTPHPERPFVRYKAPVFIDPNEQNDICIADFNNDGANDILMVGSYDRVKVLYSVPHTYEFDLTRIVVPPFFSQGASTGDFNHDGWVDAVLLNDNGLSYTMINDSTGTLVKRDFFDFVTVPASDNSGNYGSVYTDFDMDGDLDFYIAKCRQGVNNPNDPRRINALFVNDGQGNYIQDAARYGLASGRQSWTADFGDIDNDGDLDCFITQHDVISELYENINNDTFINITPASGLNIGGVPLQGMFRDFDNDGFQDILVSGDRVDYYHNNGDKTFTRMEPFGNISFGTFALGDLNHDGFTDVYASRVIPFNNPDLLREDILFLNQKNNNHYLALNLKQYPYNTSAIGAMAILYGPWGIQVREVRGGEQYGVSNGHQLIFGLGEYTYYDSLVIRWPDGLRDTFNQLEIDQHYNLFREGCYTRSVHAWPELVALCGEDSLVLVVDPLYILGWNTGLYNDSLVIKEEGLYYAILTDLNNCIELTRPVQVIINPDTLRPSIRYDGSPVLCEGEIAMLTLPSGASYQWNSGDTTQFIEVAQSGDYYADVEGYCITLSSDTLHLEFLMAGLPETIQDTFMPGETALLIAAGDSILWFSDPSGVEFIGAGDSLFLSNLTDTTTVYAQNIVFIDGQDYQLGPVTHQGTTKYNGPSVNGGLIFEVYEPVILHQITVYTDSAGIRIIEIHNGTEIIFQYEADLEPGATVLDLEAPLPAGAYTISTNTTRNNEEFGTNSPYLWRSSTGILFPYDAPGVLSMTTSTFGSDFYYYFYDWKVSTLDQQCSSALVPVTAFLDLGTGIGQEEDYPFIWMIAPNPTDGITNMVFTSNEHFDIELSTLEGKKIYSRSFHELKNGGISLDLSAYPSGIYLVRLVQDGRSFIRKIVRL